MNLRVGEGGHGVIQGGGCRGSAEWGGGRGSNNRRIVMV